MVSEQVLLADDDDALRASLGEVLSRLGFQVLEAGDGPAALDVARTADIAFSILDYHMPGMSGIEVLRALRREQPRRRFPCILISAAATADEQHEALSCGAFRFLPKPFGVESLLECLGETVRAFDAGPPGARLIACLQSGRSPFVSDVPGGLPAPLDLFFPFLRRLQQRPGEEPRDDRPC